MDHSLVCLERPTGSVRNGNRILGEAGQCYGGYRQGYIKDDQGYTFTGCTTQPALLSEVTTVVDAQWLWMTKDDFNEFLEVYDPYLNTTTTLQRSQHPLLTSSGMVFERILCTLPSSQT